MDLSIIKTLCETRKGGLTGLASNIGMTVQNLHRCIRENKIQAQDLEKIAKVLNVPISTFFTENPVVERSEQYGEKSVMAKVLNAKKLEIEVEKSPFSKVDLAKKCGISRVTLDSVIKGKEIGLHKFLKLIDYLKKDVGYFFDETPTEHYEQHGEKNVMAKTIQKFEMDNRTLAKVDEKETINDRIEFLVNHQFDGNKAAFENAVELPKSILSSYIGKQRRSKPSVDMIVKIITVLDVDARWLLTGEQTPVVERFEQRGERNVQAKTIEKLEMDNRTLAEVDEKDTEIKAVAEEVVLPPDCPDDAKLIIDKLNSEVSYLNRILEEKERLINVLMKK